MELRRLQTRRGERLRGCWRHYTPGVATEGACIWCHGELEELRVSSYHARKAHTGTLVSAQDLSPERSSAGCITALCRISFLLPYISRRLASCAG